MAIRPPGIHRQAGVQKIHVLLNISVTAPVDPQPAAGQFVQAGPPSPTPTSTPTATLQLQLLPPDSYAYGYSYATTTTTSCSPRHSDPHKRRQRLHPYLALFQVQHLRQGLPRQPDTPNSSAATVTGHDEGKECGKSINHTPTLDLSCGWWNALSSVKEHGRVNPQVAITCPSPSTRRGSHGALHSTRW